MVAVIDSFVVQSIDLRRTRYELSRLHFAER